MFKIKEILFVIVILSDIKCIMEKSREYFLSGSHHKYWDFDYDKAKKSFLFKRDGEFFLYTYSPFDKSRNKFYYGDLIVTNRWRMFGKDSLLINNGKYKILILTEDSLVLVRNGFKIDSFFCKKSPFQ